MVETIISYLILYGIQNNVVVVNGAGALQFQREKQYRSFRYINTAFLSLGILVCSAISYALHNYVYSLFDLEYFSTTIIVFIVGLYNLLVSLIMKKGSSFRYYLYHASYSYAMNFAYTLAVIFMLDLTLPIIDFAIVIAVIAVSLFATSALIGFFVESSTNTYINENFRHVPSRLFLLAIFSILLYYAGIMVA